MVYMHAQLDSVVVMHNVMRKAWPCVRMIHTIEYAL